MFLMSNVLISAVLLWGHLNTVCIFLVMPYIGITENVWWEYCLFGKHHAFQSVSGCKGFSSMSEHIEQMCKKNVVGAQFFLLQPCSKFGQCLQHSAALDLPGKHVQEILIVSSNKSLFEFIWFFFGPSPSAVKHQNVYLIKTWLQLSYRKVLKHCKPYCVTVYMLLVLHARFKVLFLSDDWDEVNFSSNFFPLEFFLWSWNQCLSLMITIRKNTYLFLLAW